MMSSPHIPIFRFGQPYESLDTVELADFRSNETVAWISQANPGLIRRDLDVGPCQPFADYTASDLLTICRQAGELFLHAELPLGHEYTQTPTAYLDALASTCGLPYTLGRANMEKLGLVLKSMPDVIRGLTRCLSVDVLDQGIGDQAGLLVSFRSMARYLGVVLPSNSPGVNSLWVPSIPLKTPVVIKPGRDDPWTPWRIIQSFIAAGAPAGAYGFYPTKHEGADVLLESTDQALLFGDAATVSRHAGDSSIHVHGPGFSKILIGEDQIECVEDILDVLVESVTANGGRSCINASTIVVPKGGRKLADLLAENLAGIQPYSLDDDRAELAPFSRPEIAEGVDRRLDSLLEKPGAEALASLHRNGVRRVVQEGATYLLPEVVSCSDPSHPLAQSEFMFPFVSVVEIPQADMLAWLGPTLVATVISEDCAFRRQCLDSPQIDRVNLGAIATTALQWDQPHEGNLFETLYRRRSIQQVIHAH